MKAAKDSEELTRVGPGTVMGEFMRQYWVPAAKSSELAADGTPMRLMLLGEKLVAFRDSSGRAGVMDHRCPHRCASLVLGRNEEDGLRCIYHGWKFDVDGNCVDMPSVPASQDFKEKVKARAYKAVDRNGMLWVYMGPHQEAPPPLPQVEATPARGRQRRHLLHAAQLQLDAGARRRHRHLALRLPARRPSRPDNVPEGHPLEHTASERAPEYHVRDTPWGTTYGAYRTVRPETIYWRFANYMFPFWTQTPQGPFPRNIQARAWVPLDDEHVMMIFWRQRGLPRHRRAAEGRQAARRQPTLARVPAGVDRLARPLSPQGAGVERLADRPRSAAQQRASIPASTISVRRTRPSPRAWAPSPTIRSNISARAT